MEGTITTNNAKGVWYVATESAPASGASYDFGSDWSAAGGLQAFEKDFEKKFEKEFKCKFIKEKDHMAELEELFEI